MDFAAKFDEGLPYTEFLTRYGTPDQQRLWAAVHDDVRLTDAQRETLAGFRRQMQVLCLAGAWCGDCVNQCPVFERFAAVTPRIGLRFFDRDDHPDLAAELQTCGAARVPAVLFLSEDGYPCGRYGDRTLAKYRQMVCQHDDRPLLEAVTQEWLDEFERIQLMLRTSPRLRARHGD